ncbi:MAG: phosphoribosylamine--glycine ligase [Granulosicoccus sp.]
MHLLLIGSGGREHAIAWKLAKSELVTRLTVAPGNAGMHSEEHIDCIAIDISETDKLIAFAVEEKVDLTVVGPESPLVNGLVDVFLARDLKIFGPCQQAAQLEGSKKFAKEFMLQNNIPTAAYRSFNDPQSALDWIEKTDIPVVIKADGLAAGKGVVVADTREQARDAVVAMFSGQFGDAGLTVVIEEFLAGEEASFTAIVSGRDCLALATSQDHKARDDGDKGPNTGGMGAYSPAPVVTPQIHEDVIANIVKPTINALADNGMAFTGFLYVGLMIDKDGNARVVEYNVRLGDPETQPLMMRMQSDLLPILLHAVNGTLPEADIQWRDGAAIGIVLAAGNYPSGSSQGAPITGIEEAEKSRCKVFHAGTKYDDTGLVTAGGRVLCVTALGDTLLEAKDDAEKAAACIRWEGARYRKDIGHRAISRDQ